MAEVGGVVRRDAADVQPGRAVVRGRRSRARRSRCRGPGRAEPSRGSRGTSGAVHACMARSVSGTAQKGGQGIAGQSPCGSGNRPRAAQPGAPRPAVRSTSGGVRCSSSASPRSPSRASGAASDPGGLLGGERLAGPPPQHGAELGVGVERDAVVDAVPVAVGHLQHVPALAVGVVDHDVEHRHPAQRRRVLVDQRDRLVVLVDPVEDVPEARRDRARRRPASRPPARSSGSRQSCTIPRPCGPSRRNVRGTTSQPSASLTRYAATSRWASVPSGKSHSGRSPAIGL